MALLTRQSRPSPAVPALRGAMSRLFDESFWDPWVSWRGLPALSFDPFQFVPDVDVSETEKEVTVEANVPGYDPKRIEVEIKDDVLVMKGMMDEEKEEKGKRYYRRERRAGAFCREIGLPPVDETKAKCTVKDGILIVSVPKVDVPKGRRLKVEVQS